MHAYTHTYTYTHTHTHTHTHTQTQRHTNTALTFRIFSGTRDTCVLNKACTIGSDPCSDDSDLDMSFGLSIHTRCKYLSLSRTIPQEDLSALVGKVPKNENEA